MGRKKRKQKHTTKPNAKRADAKGAAKNAPIATAKPSVPIEQSAAKPEAVKPEAAKPEAVKAEAVKPEEVVAAIVEAVAPPLFEEAPVRTPEPSGVRAIEAAIESTPSLMEPEQRHAERPPPYSDHRAYPRISLAVAIDLGSDSHFFSGLSGDVSEGGVFVQTYRELPLGSEVEIDFDLPTGRIQTHGTVRWHRSPSESAPPGVGIAFQELADEARSLIHEFCEARAPLYYDVEHA